VSIQGTGFDNPQRSSRAAVDIVAVIDRSSSMKDKMPLLQDTLKFMVHQLKPTDRLGLVLYDENVETVLPLTFMDSVGRVRFEGKEGLTLRITPYALYPI
jgi:hypothetical protein